MGKAQSANRQRHRNCHQLGAVINSVVSASLTHPVRVSDQTLPTGARVRYGCTPPLKGVVVRRDGGSHWVEFPGEGLLRCNTFDLKVLREGE